MDVDSEGALESSTLASSPRRRPPHIHASPRPYLSKMLDPFEIRMAFLSHLRKLNASQASIQKVVSFAVKHGSRCADDIWDCILEECEHVSLLLCRRCSVASKLLV